MNRGTAGYLDCVATSVLINEKIADSGIELLASQFDVTVMPGWSLDELEANITEFDGIVIRSATMMTPQLIDAASSLKVIGRAGVGVDNVDLPAASQRGIIVVNAPSSTVTSVAEHALGMMFSLARNIPRGDASMRAGVWERSSLGGVELAGKTLALLGVGRIGQRLAELARGVGMEVVGYDPFVARDRFTKLGIGYCATIQEAMACGDFISLHMPLTDDTRNLVNDTTLAGCRPGSRLINTARGALIDLDALHGALTSGQLAGAAIDVYPVEPPVMHPVFSLPNIVLTPHLAASTREAQDRAGVAVAEQVVAALGGGGVVTTAVNVPSIAAEDVSALQPYVPLTGRLARLAQALAGAPLSRLTIGAHGDIGAFDVRMLSYNALIAMFADTTDEAVTFVNARNIAERRGIEVVETASESAADFQNLVTVETQGDRAATVTGTTLGAEHRPWLVSALGYDIDIELTPNMAFFNYADVPGMIGRVGTAFGAAGVNIANMAVSRNNGRALMAVSFDAEPPAGLVADIASTPDFDWAWAVSL